MTKTEIEVATKALAAAIARGDIDTYHALLVTLPKYDVLNEGDPNDPNSLVTVHLYSNPF